MPNLVLKARSQHALAVRRHGRDSQEAVDAHRELTVAKLHRAVEEALNAAPPPTGEQLRQVAALMTSGGAR